jgi:hypothetical protein
MSNEVEVSGDGETLGYAVNRAACRAFRLVRRYRLNGPWRR